MSDEDKAKVKVVLASISPADDGVGMVLKLTTEDKVNIEFLLDDMATSLLSFTSHYAAKEIQGRVGEDTSKLMMFGRNK